MSRKLRVKHVPKRTCIICRSTLAKRTLNRIVRSPDGVVYDASGKLSGRGAYLCNNTNCWSRAIDSKAIDRALKTRLSNEERIALRTEINRRAQAVDPT